MRKLASAKTLRHARLITAAQVRALSQLPPELLTSRAAGLRLSEHHAALLKETLDFIRRTRGDESARHAAARWAGAANLKGLFDMAQDDLYPELPSPPFPGTGRLKPILTKAGVRETALRYRNCLRNQIRYASAGESAFYEWIGPPGAVIEIWKDPLYGWRLSEAKLARNAAVSPEQRSEIATELRSLGMSVGRTHWQLENDLGAAHQHTFQLLTEEERLEDVF